MKVEFFENIEEIFSHLEKFNDSPESGIVLTSKFQVSKLKQWLIARTGKILADIMSFGSFTSKLASFIVPDKELASFPVELVASMSTASEVSSGDTDFKPLAGSEVFLKALENSFFGEEVDGRLKGFAEKFRQKVNALGFILESELLDALRNSRELLPWEKLIFAGKPFLSLKEIKFVKELSKVVDVMEIALLTPEIKVVRGSEMVFKSSRVGEYIDWLGKNLNVNLPSPPELTIDSSKIRVLLGRGIDVETALAGKEIIDEYNKNKNSISSMAVMTRSGEHISSGVRVLPRMGIPCNFHSFPPLMSFQSVNLWFKVVKAVLTDDFPPDVIYSIASSPAYDNKGIVQMLKSGNLGFHRKRSDWEETVNSIIEELENEIQKMESEKLNYDDDEIETLERKKKRKEVLERNRECLKSFFDEVYGDFEPSGNGKDKEKAVSTAELVKTAETILNRVMKSSESWLWVSPLKVVQDVFLSELEQVEEEMKPSDFVSVIESILKSSGLKEWETSGAIDVVEISSGKLAPFKKVFLLGANEGLFPYITDDNPFYSTSGEVFDNPNFRSVYEENLLFLHAIASADEVVITASAEDEYGDEKVLSLLVEKLVGSNLETCDATDQDPLLKLETESVRNVKVGVALQGLMEAYSSLLAVDEVVERSGGGVVSSYEKILGEVEEVKKSAEEFPVFAVDFDKSAESLLKSDKRFYPSVLDYYGVCPVRYILEAFDVEEFKLATGEIVPRTMGLILHRAMEKLGEMNFKNIGYDEIRQAVEDSAGEVLYEESLEYKLFELSKGYVVQVVEEAVNLLIDYLGKLRFGGKKDDKVKNREQILKGVGFQTEGEVAWKFKKKDDAEINLQGRFDLRADFERENGEKITAVIDYKSSSSNNRYSEFGRLRKGRGNTKKIKWGFVQPAVYILGVSNTIQEKDRKIKFAYLLPLVEFRKGKDSTVEVSYSDIEEVKERVYRSVAGVELGLVVPFPSNDRCYYCPFKNICRVDPYIKT